MIRDALWQTAVELHRYLDSCQFAFCFIGGIAVQRWGEPRMTSDVDATVVIPFGAERESATEILKRYQSRIADPISFAIQARILLLQDLSGNRIDLSLGGLPYEQRMIDRAFNWTVPGHGQIRTCSAEDLIVLKAFASRPQDWIDVERVIVRQGSKLNRSLILEELAPLADLKETTEILGDLEELFTRLEAK